MAKNRQELSYDIPPEGSLGLLALGATGIRAWRNKRNNVEPMRKQDANEKA